MSLRKITLILGLATVFVNGCGAVARVVVNEAVKRMGDPGADACRMTDVKYDKLKDAGKAWEPVSRGATQNNTSKPLTVTFTSSVETTVTVSVGETAGGEVGGALEFIHAAVKAEVNHSVVLSTTTKIGSSPTAEVPPGKTANAIYGVKVQVTRGHLAGTKHCPNDASDKGTFVDYGTVTTYVPISEGWCIWIEGKDPCPTV